MLRRFHLAGWLLPGYCVVIAIFISLPLPVAGGEIIDRIVATVDHRAILASEWDEEIRVECLLNGRPLAAVTADEKRKALDRLIDQALIRDQMDAVSFPRATPEQVAGQVKALRAQNPAWSTDAGWNQALAAYGLTPDDIAAHAAIQYDIFHFVDQRFRPGIHIDRRTIQQYYSEQFLPELRRGGGAEVPLKDVSPKIEELLVQQRMDELLTAWLHTLRTQTPVQLR
jgi:peptidyl-prolyl cis-trans isomerase SurA